MFAQHLWKKLEVLYGFVRDQIRENLIMGDQIRKRISS